jgi:hypothetical protein
MRVRRVRRAGKAHPVLTRCSLAEGRASCRSVKCVRPRVRAAALAFQPSVVLLGTLRRPSPHAPKRRCATVNEASAMDLGTASFCQSPSRRAAHHRRRRSRTQMHRAQARHVHPLSVNGHGQILDDVFAPRAARGSGARYERNFAKPAAGDGLLSIELEPIRSGPAHDARGPDRRDRHARSLLLLRPRTRVRVQG